MRTQTQVPLDCLASGGGEVGSSNRGNTEGVEDPQTSLKRYRKHLRTLACNSCSHHARKDNGNELRLHVFCLYLCLRMCCACRSVPCQEGQWYMLYEYTCLGGKTNPVETPKGVSVGRGNARSNGAP